jgi:ElaB/YqjD/DUF883 family membrane-anchored ribosome-binding protein
MSIEDIGGTARGNGAGAGEVVDKAKSEAKAFAGKVKAETAAETQDTKEHIGRIADQARESIVQITRHATDAYGEFLGKAQAVTGRIEPMVKEKPYMTLGAAVGMGFLLGQLLAWHGPRVIYVKSRD